MTAQKRPWVELQVDSDEPPRRRTKLATIINEALLAETLRKFFNALEPMIRRAVHDEVTQRLQQHGHVLFKPSQLQIKAVEAPRLKLQFVEPAMPKTIFTNNKVLDAYDSPLQVKIVRADSGCTQMIPGVKIEVVVLDGDFASDETKEWSSDEFSAKIVKQREGRRPLIVGASVVLPLQDETVSLPDIAFTDNSSWIRGRKFRIGARVVSGSSKIREAMTDSFMVKDHRGELYKKHHPPMLTDETWRLKCIAKDGKFHKRLDEAKICTVQDFLRKHIVNPEELKKILRMSDKQWSETLKHAKTCEIGRSIHILRSEGCVLELSPIGEIIRATIGGKTVSLQNAPPQTMRFLNQLALQAHQIWDQLEINCEDSQQQPMQQREDEEDQWMGCINMDCSIIFTEPPLF